jgi:predicted RNase H-like HicB family nuclease
MTALGARALGREFAKWIHDRLLDKPMLRQFKIIVEKHPDGYVAYPLGLKGVVVGDGGTYDEALADVKSAIQFHIETFGAEALPADSSVLEAFIAEATIPA